VPLAICHWRDDTDQVSDDTSPVADAIGAVVLAWFGFHLLNNAPRRIFAFLVDLALVVPFAIALNQVASVPDFVRGPLDGALPLLVPYRIFCHWRFGRTLGKWAFGLEVTERSNEVLPFEGSMNLLTADFRRWLPPFSPRRSDTSPNPLWRRTFGVCFKRELPLIVTAVWPIALAPIPVGEAFGLILIIGLMCQVGWLLLDIGAMADSHGTSSLHDLFAGTRVGTRAEAAAVRSLEAATP
jgi:uncharacterized RDD family membrane protein YckC